MKKTLCTIVIIFLLICCAFPVSAKDDNGQNSNGAGNGMGTTPDNSMKNNDRGVGNDQNMPGQNQSGGNIAEPMNQGQQKHEGGGGGESNQGMMESEKSNFTKDISKFNNNLNASLENETPVRRGWIKNENDVREAVHALLAMENLTDGIGPQVSAIAREFNNSEDSSDRVEAEIQEQNPIFRFLFGGNVTAASELANITANNQILIQQLQQLEAGANIDPDILQLYQQQVATLQAEQARLEQLSADTRKDRGILGWL
jgi:hypothetical protein